MYHRTGAQIIITLLERQGVSWAFGIPGGANLPLYDALSQSTQIRHVLARHEQGAGFMAQGMARATGRPAVCLATSGPGATNILTPLADAMADSIPLIIITGQVPRSLLGTNAFQEVDTASLARPIAKRVFFANSAQDLLTLVPHAFRIASSGRPGPVLIDVPKDVQMETTFVKAWPEPGSPQTSEAPEALVVQRAADLINASQCPLLYLGGGVIHSGASELVCALAEKAGAPAVTTLMALGCMGPRHPLNLGMPGMHAAPFTNWALEECDLLIALGARFDDRATGKLSEFCPSAKTIHMDIDARELGKLRKSDAPIRSELSRGLQALIPLVHPTPRSAWRQRVQTLKAKHPLAMPLTGDPMNPYRLIRNAAQLLGSEAIITSDVGQHQMWVAQAYPFSRPRQWLTSGGLGTMGFGLPAAIGAALADPSRRVACFSGDGSLLMNIQELATLAEENLDIKIILLDNASLGLVHQQQDLFYGRRRFASAFKGGTDFCAVAQAFGIPALALGKSSDPLAALRQAITTPGPALIHVPLSDQEKVFPMVAPGKANREMILHDAMALGASDGA